MSKELPVYRKQDLSLVVQKKMVLCYLEKNCSASVWSKKSGNFTVVDIKIQMKLVPLDMRRKATALALKHSSWTFNL